MESNRMENVTDNPNNLAGLTQQVAKAKGLCDDIFEDGKQKVERTFRKGILATEDCIEDTTHFIKRHPWPSVGTAIGIGAIVGLFAGWQASRCCERSQ